VLSRRFLLNCHLAWSAWKPAAVHIYQARVLSGLGHELRLISQQFVTPNIKSNKNDRIDLRSRWPPVDAVRSTKIAGTTGATGCPPHPAEADLGPDAACEADTRPVS
jgi:hypothetical protein